MNPEQERKLRQQGRPTFIQRGLSPRERLGNLAQDVGNRTLTGVEMVGRGLDNAFGLPGRVVTGFNENVPTGFSEQVGQATEQATSNRRLGMVAGLAAGIATPDPLGEAKAVKKGFQGFKDLSTKVLERDLQGKVGVSSQFIKDSVKAADVKEAERKILMDVLDEYKGEKKIPVGEFAEKVKANLIPLKPIELSENALEAAQRPRYSSVHLPNEQRGINYAERVYEAPQFTHGAGRKHFGNLTPHYFGHIRADDIVEPASGNFSSMDEALEAGKKKGFTRRILEVQSDLHQKGRVEKEMKHLAGPYQEQAQEIVNEAFAKGRSVEDAKKIVQEKLGFAKSADWVADQTQKAADKLNAYRNTFWQRLMREEVKKAAGDGAKKMQVPAGETAMRIEGLAVGGADDWIIDDGISALTPDKIKPGQRVGSYSYDQEFVIVRPEQQEGAFKAIPASLYDDIEDGIMDEFYSQGRDVPEVGSDEWLDFARDYGLESEWETFSINAEVDPDHPVFKFYEKDMGKWLKNKYGAELVQDKFGNAWWEFNVPKEARKLPVEAFAITGAVGGGAALGNAQSTQSQSGQREL